MTTTSFNTLLEGTIDTEMSLLFLMFTCWSTKFNDVITRMLADTGTEIKKLPSVLVVVPELDPLITIDALGIPPPCSLTTFPLMARF